MDLINSRDVPMMVGECPHCHSGQHSLVIVKRLADKDNSVGSLDLKCVVCFHDLIVPFANQKLGYPILIK